MSDSSAPAPAPAAETSPEVPLPVTGRFFSRRDKLAFVISFAVTFIGYLSTVAPSVTLEDSGEFLTAMRHLGVPHPPGYPIWTMLAWLWQWIVPVGNIAWRGNLMSAFFGALAIGLAGLLISKSGHVMAGRVGYLREQADERWLDGLILASAVAASLMLAFAPVMWSQAIITEVYALNAFFLMLTLALLYRWSFETERRWRLYLAAVVWGVSLTSHQTLVLLVIAFPCFIWFADRRLGRDALLPILAVIVIAVIKMAVTKTSILRQGPFSAVWVLAHGVGAAGGIYWLLKDRVELMRRWPQVVTLYGAVVLGLSLYLYMPVSSATNPPMNWGYTRTTEGFLHQFTRGQYEKVQTERSLLAFWGQLNMFVKDLQWQFNVVFALAALLALFFYQDLPRRERDWLKFLLIAFLFLGLDFIFLSNPTFEKQKLFTDRVFFLPGHCLYALWIGYGLILGIGYLHVRQRQVRAAAPVLAVFVGLLPIVSVAWNWKALEQHGHDFGYAFGYLMFKPGGGYPEMERGAVLYGGTDPGRFVPTYMIFVESQAPPRAKTKSARFPDSGTFDRRDVYLITQNALADSTYMSYIRDHYGETRPDPARPATLAERPGWQNTLLKASWRLLGRDDTYPREPLWIPSRQDSEAAFRQYINEYTARQPMPGEDVRIDEHGRVSVQGVVGVMAINGILTKEIFEKNKDKHAFYVEESYVIPWMLPYLEPYGIILKINKEPLPAPEEKPELWKAIVERDRAYWAELRRNYLTGAKFQRDDVAQKTFAKQRAASAGIYAFRRMAVEAEQGFLDAIEMCPDSSEGNFRLAQLYVETARFDDAETVLRRYLKNDPLNLKIGEGLKQLKELRQQIEEEQWLEAQFRASPGDKQVGLQLLMAYARRQRIDAMDALTGTLVARPELGSNEFLAIAQIYAQTHRLDRVSDVLTLYVQRFPQNPVGWYNLAVVLASRQDCDSALIALGRALALDSAAGEVRSTAQRDPRFGRCRSLAQFQQLVGAAAGAPAMPAPGSPFVITR
jgi:tetratricopeptide (TPR) repeat protein